MTQPYATLLGSDVSLSAIKADPSAFQSSSPPSSLPGDVAFSSLEWFGISGTNVVFTASASSNYAFPRANGTLTMAPGWSPSLTAASSGSPASASGQGAGASNLNPPSLTLDPGGGSAGGTLSGWRLGVAVAVTVAVGVAIAVAATAFALRRRRQHASTSSPKAVQVRSGDSTIA